MSRYFPISMAAKVTDKVWKMFMVKLHINRFFNTITS